LDHLTNKKATMKKMLRFFFYQIVNKYYRKGLTK